MRKVARKTAVKKAARKTAAGKTAKKPAAARPETAKRYRTQVLNEHPGNLVVDASDHAAIEAIDLKQAKASRASHVRKRSAADRSAMPEAGETPAGSMIERVSSAIERELTKIERLVGNPERLAPAHRIEAESRARVLASLARTLKEVMRLREQERGVDDKKAADDDAMPRDLDEFRRELSRRLEGLVAAAAPVSAGGNEPG
ncbi:hypothetical protein [Afipia clevelandensis]|uniref:hypothetical protein n=1 Tax=Afipia clevelandensis TaxID=1034 RepID=UPI00031DF55E|nr:hypothetical protein [Afipia clevelandensis]